MGFGFEVCDREGQPTRFIRTDVEVLSALGAIRLAQWASVDVETTGLTDASVPVTLNSGSLKMGASSVVRMRTIQVRVPTVLGRNGPRADFVFDCDKLSPGTVAEIANAILGCPLFIAHNAGFDLYWLRRAGGRRVMPSMVADTMLLTRLLQPRLVLVRANLVSGIRRITDVPLASAPAQAAWKSLIGGASGSSLADVVLAMFGVVVDKSYQMPNNWTGLLGFGHYEYALDDVVWADRILNNLLGTAEDGDLFQGYLDVRERKATVRLLEPQVPDLVRLREQGMPINKGVGAHFVAQQRAVLAAKVAELIALAPTLVPYRDALGDPDTGLAEELKEVVATAFEARGVLLRHTAATGSAQVGEKDLRACKAAMNDESRPLFNAWVAVNRAKKASNMALEVVGFAQRSRDNRVHSLLSHGPVTGRLAASEPNCQQWPRNQLFRSMCMSDIYPGRERLSVQVTDVNKSLLAKAGVDAVALFLGNWVDVDTAWFAALLAADKEVPDWPSAERDAVTKLVEACFTHRIVASDFGALDVRVGASLCVRSQREMLALSRGQAVPGPVQPSDEIVRVIQHIGRLLETGDPSTALATQVAASRVRIAQLDAQLAQLVADLDDGKIERKQFYQERAPVKAKLLVARLGYRWAQCLAVGVPRGEQEYSALRDAFVADIDIHTFTGMKLAGRDPMLEFSGLAPSERKSYEKKLKKELGPRRQQGKIANLSLLYGMADAGFQEAAARGYDEHWSMAEAGRIRSRWMDAYPEVELWHLWTECLQGGTLYLPEPGREKPVRTGWWLATTLAGRDIVSFGLNAALSYQDQSTGADIMGLIMHRLAVEYPEISVTAINQVHDEVVFAWPAETHEHFLPLVEAVMTEEANSLTMPYGVPCNVSPASGVLWIKD